MGKSLLADMRVHHPALAPGNWLSSLKARQLQRVAFEAGVLSSGTKPILIDRLTQTLRSSGLNTSIKDDGQRVHGSRRKGPLSILSIDMGIRNLAFAHLLVPPDGDNGLEKRGSSSLFGTPELNAWDRLAISSFPSSMDGDTSEDRLASISALGDMSKSFTKGKPQLKSKSPSIDEPTVKESFAPNLYASHAYTLITSLVDAYKPTHILIEKQRFRSSGGSAVQEWTIRVGVFEGMLYAVLHTLQQERKEGGLKPISVQGIDPQRVVRFWLEKDENLVPATATAARVHKRASRRAKKGGDGDKITPTTKKRVSSKEGKKAKIDLVGKWISGCRDVASIAEVGVRDRIGVESGRLRLGGDCQVNEVADAYLRKWKGEMRKKSASDKGDIGKLDDLADCLLQGITWLDWEAARNRISHHGFSAIPEL